MYIYIHLCSCTVHVNYSTIYGNLGDNLVQQHTVLFRAQNVPFRRFPNVGALHRCPTTLNTVKRTKGVATQYRGYVYIISLPAVYWSASSRAPAWFFTFCLGLLCFSSKSAAFTGHSGTTMAAQTFTATCTQNVLRARVLFRQRL